MKKMSGDITILQKIHVPKIMIICYTVPEIEYVMDVILLFNFELFFALLTPLTTRKIKIKKKK